MKAVRTWVLIADGAHAKLLEHSGEASGLKALDGLTFSVDLPSTHELLTDRAGRGYESHGSGRHAKEGPTDPHRELKRAFAKKVAGVLKDQLAEKRFDRLVLVAPPKTLGDLRDALPKTVRQKVTAELAADLVKTPSSQLRRHLVDVLPAQASGLKTAARRTSAPRGSRKS